MEQSVEGLLLSFDERYPCWTPAMLALAELDRTAADDLTREGLLSSGRAPTACRRRGGRRF